jgi:hypothetical protein
MASLVSEGLAPKAVETAVVHALAELRRKAALRIVVGLMIVALGIGLLLATFYSTNGMYVIVSLGPVLAGAFIACQGIFEARRFRCPKRPSDQEPLV